MFKLNAQKYLGALFLDQKNAIFVRKITGKHHFVKKYHEC